jgi:hypothetical protein
VYSEASTIHYLGSQLLGCMTTGVGSQDGGAYHDGDSSITFTDGVVLNCMTDADGQGGGLYNDGAAVLVSPTQFSHCTARNGGGAYNDTARVAFVNCSFQNYNEAWNDGGGLYNHSSRVTLANCLMFQCQARNVGAAIASDASTLVATNCTITENVGAAASGAIEAFGRQAASIANSILWRNVAASTINESTQLRAASGTSLAVDFCAVGGWTGGLGGAGNFGLHPAFIAPATGDFRLGTGSPCRDAGANALLPADVADLDADSNLLEALPLDLDSVARIQSGTVNMGAYEATP